MRETPASFRARTGLWPPAADLRAAAAALGTTPRAPLPDEPCPTLYRDVGPQALGDFLEGRLARLSGPGAPCTFLRDGSLPPFGPGGAELGVLAVLSPLALGPWLSGQAGIWVAEADRMPAEGTLGFVPGGEALTGVDARLVDVGDTAALREALGGAAYDDRVEAAREAIRSYLEDWEAVERASHPLRAVLDGPSALRRDELLAAMESEGVTEKDLRAPWIHLTRARRDAVRGKLAGLASRRGLLP